MISKRLPSGQIARKLTDDQVASIKQTALPVKVLAKQYNVTPNYIYLIRNERHRKNVNVPTVSIKHLPNTGRFVPKLTDVQIAEIKQTAERGSVLAKKFGVSLNYIYQIRGGSERKNILVETARIPNLTEEERKLRNKRYKLANKKKIQAQERIREKIYRPKYRAANRDKIRQQMSIISGRRRARMLKIGISPCADTFYKFVRSKELIRCYYCGTWISGAKAHIDHVIAVSRHGNHASSNLCASCPTCNFRKHDRLPSDLNFLNQPLLNL